MQPKGGDEMAHAFFCRDENHKQQIQDMQARLDAMQGEINQLRAENERLRKLARPVLFVDAEGTGVGEYTYETSDGGW